MGKKVKVASSVFIFAASVGGLVSYDVYLKDKINTEDVLVVAQGTTISESQTLNDKNIIVEGRPKTQIPEGAILAKDAERVIGKNASVKISGNTVITEDQVDFKDVVPNKEDGESIRPITSDMIFAVNETIRRGDNIDIYAMTEIEWGNLSRNNPDEIVSGNPNEVSNNEPILTDVKVAYVRDGSNGEVRNADGSESDNEEANQESSGRLYGTNTVSELELILNEEDFQKLMSQVAGHGKKLYIVYN